MYCQGRAGILTSTVGFIRPVPAVIVPIAHPGGADAHARAAAVFVTPALVHFAVTFIAVVSTIILKVTFVGQWDAGPRLLAAELGVQITNGSRAVSLVAHVTAVVVKIAPPDAIDTVPVAAPILVTETGVLFSDAGVVLPLVALRALTHQVPGREDAAGHTLWTPAAFTVVGPGQAEQAAWPGHAGIASSRPALVENLHVHQPRELTRENRHLGAAVFGSSEDAELRPVIPVDLILKDGNGVGVGEVVQDDRALLAIKSDPLDAVQVGICPVDPLVIHRDAIGPLHIL